MSERLLKKMRALLKMSREAVNEHEAATAMRQLHALLAQHNVEMKDVDGPEASGNGRFHQMGGGVGTEVNRHFALKMIENIVHTINLASQTEANKRWHKGPEWSRFQTSFLNAASLTISERCQALIDSSMRNELEDETGTAMVLASVYDTLRQVLKQAVRSS